MYLRGLFFADSGGLLRRCGVVVHDSGHMSDVFIDLLDAGHFSLKGLCHINHTLGRSLGFFHYLIHAGFGFFCNGDSLVDSIDGALDQLCGLSGSLGGLFRQILDLLGYDSKSAACLTGSCTFDRCIQCKKIRLAGNI